MKWLLRLVHGGEVGWVKVSDTYQLINGGASHSWSFLTVADILG